MSFITICEKIIKSIAIDNWWTNMDTKYLSLIYLLITHIVLIKKLVQYLYVVLFCLEMSDEEMNGSTWVCGWVTYDIMRPTFTSVSLIIVFLLFPKQFA